MNLVSSGNDLKLSEDLGVGYVELAAQHNAEQQLIRCKPIFGQKIRKFIE